MAATINFLETTEPATPSTGRTRVYIDTADKHLKTKDSIGTVRDLTDSAILATPAEVQAKINTKGVSPQGVYNMPALSKFQVKNIVTGLSKVVPDNNVPYNLLTDMVSADESVTGNIGTVPDFYTRDSVFNPNANDGTQFTTWLDDTNNRIIFPSNKNTYGDGTYHNYTNYNIRVTIIFNIPSTSNQSTRVKVSLKRADESVVASDTTMISDLAALTGVSYTANFLTFVGSSTLN